MGDAHVAPVCEDEIRDVQILVQVGVRQPHDGVAVRILVDGVQAFPDACGDVREALGPVLPDDLPGREFLFAGRFEMVGTGLEVRDQLIADPGHAPVRAEDFLLPEFPPEEGSGQVGHAVNFLANRKPLSARAG